MDSSVQGEQRAVPAEGFADRVSREAKDEAAAVVAELAALRFRADQVVRVLKALGLERPPELALLMVAGDPQVAEAVRQPPQPEGRMKEAVRALDVQLAPAADIERAEDARRQAAQAPAQPAAPPASAAPKPSIGAPDARRAAEQKRIAAEEAVVLADVQEYGPTMSLEIGARTRLSAGMLGDRLRALAAKEAIGLAGDIRKNSPLWIVGGHPARITDELAQYPAAATEMPLAVMVTVAMQERNVVAAARKLGKPFTARELEAAAQMPYARLTDDLNALADQGRFMKRTGHMRRAAGQTAGRAAVEYVAVGDAPAVAATAPETAAQAPERATLPEVRGHAASAARDWVVSQKAEFTPAQMMEALDEDEAIVRTCLRQFAERGIVAYVGMDDLELYQYVKPKAAGAAAELDAARRPASVEQTVGSSNGSGAPVPGTGHRIEVAHKETNGLLKKAYGKGAQVERAGSGHIAVINPANGRRMIMSSTPQSGGTAKNVKKLREIGLDVEAVSDAGVTYAEIRAWAVFLEVFTARDIADAMHVHPAVGDRALKALLWHGIVEPTGDALELNEGPERIYRYKPLPPGPKVHVTETPPEIKVPAELGGDPLRVRRGLPVNGMTGGQSLRARRQRLSVTGGTRKR